MEELGAHVVGGDKQAVEARLHHPWVRAVSFVGSTPVAESGYRQASERCRTVLAELVCELPLLRTPIGEFHSGSAAPNFVRPE